MNDSGSSHTAKISPAPLSDAEVAASEIADSAIAERLPRIRAASTAWGASVSAITALFGAGVVVDADDQVRALAPGWGAAYGLTAALALATAGASIYLAARAAESRLTPLPWDVGGRVAAVDRQFRSAVRNLAASRICALAAVVLLMAALAVRWYAPVVASGA